MINTWKSGNVIALRGIYEGHVSYMQSAIVVRDGPEEVALAILPGAECCAPADYVNGKYGKSGRWDRWAAYIQGNRELQAYTWQINRLLILLHPEKYYGSYYFWEAATNRFLCYYINFQLPFRRNQIGFDTFDLELDIVIKPTYEWHYKDEEDYRRGIACGILLEEWVHEINAAKPEVFDKLAKRQYPFDGTWLDWKPNPNWTPPPLPENWDKI